MKFRNFVQKTIINSFFCFILTTTVGCSLRQPPKLGAWWVSSLAGGRAGYQEAHPATARFHSPSGVAVDAKGNIYVADTTNHRLRALNLRRTVSTLAGSGVAGFQNHDTGTMASFDSPTGVAVHEDDGNVHIYVADTGNHRIRKITSAGAVSTLAGSGTSGNTNGMGTSASFNSPSAVAVHEDDDGVFIYVADTGNHLIRKIASSGAVTTLAGSGTSGNTNGMGTSASFNSPSAVAVHEDDDGVFIYVADSGSHRIRKITSAGDVSTLAGSESGFRDHKEGTSARFNSPKGVAVDKSGNVYVADTGNNRIRRISPDGGVVTIAGNSMMAFADGRGMCCARFSKPEGIAISGFGYIVVADTGNHRIRKLEQK